MRVGARRKNGNSKFSPQDFEFVIYGSDIPYTYTDSVELPEDAN